MRNKIAAILNLVEDSKDLRPLTQNRPVASLPFACRYRLIDFPFSALYNAEVNSAALFISESGHSLYDHIRSGANWGLDSPVGGGVFTHSQIELKTLRAERDEEFNITYFDNHRKYVQKSKADYVLLCGSNMLSNISLNAILQYHQEKNADITAAFKKVSRKALKKDTETFAYYFDGNEDDYLSKMEKMSEVPYEDKTVSLGMNYVIMGKEVFNRYLKKAEEGNSRIDGNTFLRYSLENGDKAYGYEYTGYLKSIEDIPSYFEANMEILEEKNFNALFYRNDPIITRPRHGAPTYYGPNAVVNNALIASDCEIYGKVENSLLYRQTKIREDTEVSCSIIMHGTKIGKNCYLKYVILDKNIKVGDNVHLEGTREKPLVFKKGDTIESGKVIREGSKI
ncbi:glucose-1-phosphate adenylyltransferase subunit GlgD [Lacticigenium naphthae]|uniref:glucose-1-phosphate adenylyltransferase subunit GlgD n=1 Tax=Lacticigenium naphthae TaxID=515351 RepID=UPI00041BD729|nr:glucose-1-phosphate adenylyltransferase subunit GlgD [Lacticigenium naphthae]